MLQLARSVESPKPSLGSLCVKAIPFSLSRGSASGLPGFVLDALGPKVLRKCSGLSPTRERQCQVYMSKPCTSS